MTFARTIGALALLALAVVIIVRVMPAGSGTVETIYYPTGMGGADMKGTGVFGLGPNRDDAYWNRVKAKSDPSGL